MARWEFYAHVASDGRRQSLSEHLHNTAALAKAFAAAFGGSEQAQLAALAHDIGKYFDPFQNRLLYGGPKVDHASAGALECLRRNQPFAALAVMGHHTGLPEGGTPADTAGTFLGRIRQAAACPQPGSDRWKEEIQLPCPLPPGLSEPGEMMFFTRMLFSCLTDADYLDTEAFMRQGSDPVPAADFDRLWARFQESILPWSQPKEELNQQRWAVLQRCMEQGQLHGPGVFTLTVPAGGGKTAASLGFALAQARKHKLSRILYVIPYTSIIEQTADLFRRILGEDQVLEHHSGALSDGAQGSAHASENWDMPVIVTTAVQFFESLYASSPGKCRKLHNLAGSVILFDEAQLLPLSYLRPCVFAMAQLVKHYGASIVLCSATQPVLGPLFREFLPEAQPRELCPQGSFSWEPFRRVTFRRIPDTSWQKLAAAVSQTRQALCIVNTRRSAQLLYALLQGDGVFHLSTLMCPAHRRRVLEEVRARLQRGMPCRVVSTSLIEAGVDLDFPAVFREEAGLDSLLQAAGRCNREGLRPSQESIVTIFRAEPPPPVLRTAIEVSRMILDQYEDPASPDAIRAYFHELLEVKGAAFLDSQGILALMKDALFPFQRVADRFKLIQADTRTVYIPLDVQAQSLLSQLRRGQPGKRLLRQLGQYGVPVYPRHFAALGDAGALEILDCGAAILTDSGLYQAGTGLSLDADSPQGQVP